MFKVLVVDDEIWMCEGLKIIVSKLGLNYTVADVAADGREALRKLQNEHFDVVITDINMPNMNGLELMEKMKAGGYNQPVIIISAYHEFEYARSALRLGAVDYLIKPIKNDELSSVLMNLQDLIERERQQSARMLPLEKLQGLESGAELIENMLRLIEQSYMEDLSLSLIADQAGYNSSYLSRLFKLEAWKASSNIFVRFVCDMPAGCWSKQI